MNKSYLNSFKDVIDGKQLFRSINEIIQKDNDFYINGNEKCGFLLEYFIRDSIMRIIDIFRSLDINNLTSKGLLFFAKQDFKEVIKNNRDRYIVKKIVSRYFKKIMNDMDNYYDYTIFMTVDLFRAYGYKNADNFLNQRFKNEDFK